MSRALNDRPGISHDLRARILERARALNYVPNHTARGLATAQTFAIGFFIREKPGMNSHADPFYSEILHGVEQGLSQTDYHVAFAVLNDDALSNPASFRFSRERRVDGMIFAGPDIPSPFIVAMISSGIPVLLVDNDLAYSRVHSVIADDEGGGYLATRHLIKQGHRAIGMIAGPAEWASSRARVRGYTRAMSETQLSPCVVHAERTTVDSGYGAFEALIKQAPDITALFAVNDAMAIGAIRAARAAGRQVPADLSVIGFDDVAWASLNDPPLTTIEIPKQQMGVEAARRILSLIDHPDDAPTHLTVSVRLIERQSTLPIQSIGGAMA